jgi:formylglycine-generating enzyme
MRLSMMLISIAAVAALAPSAALGADAKPIVAVFNLEAKALRLKPQLLLALSDYLADSLAATGAFQVVPRDRLRQRLVAQKKRSYKECYDQTCQVEIGKELAANKSLAARLLKIGGVCVLTATLYDLRRAATEGGATSEGKCSEDAFRRAIGVVVHKLAGHSSATPAATPAVRDSAPMVKVPAGPFLRGSTAGQGNADERPQRSVQLGAFEIDKREVTVGQYRACVQAGVCTEPSREKGCGARGDDLPATCVDWKQATSYCGWVGKRLPAEAEWEKAARGADGRSYPWGNAAPDCKRAAMGGCGKALPSGGSCVRGDSPYGAQDLAGSVREWVSDGYDAKYYATSPAKNPPGPRVTSLRVHRGGSYLDDAAGLRSAARDHSAPTYSHHDLGFRCARSH